MKKINVKIENRIVNLRIENVMESRIWRIVTPLVMSDDAGRILVIVKLWVQGFCSNIYTMLDLISISDVTKAETPTTTLRVYIL